MTVPKASSLLTGFRRLTHRVQDSVDKLRRLFIGEFFGQFHRFVDDDGAFGPFDHDFVGSQPQDRLFHLADIFVIPTLQMFANLFVDLFEVFNRSVEKP